MQIDKYILSLFNEIRHHHLDGFFELITWLGSLWLLLPLGLLITVGMMWAGQHGTFSKLYLLLSLVVASAVTFVLKMLIDRQRPDLFETWVELPADAAFPSAHSAQVGAFCMALWFLLPLSLRLIIGWLLLLTGVMVMISRLYLQVHWPSDVLAGGVLGVVCAIALRFILLPREGVGL